MFGLKTCWQYNEEQNSLTVFPQSCINLPSINGFNELKKTTTSAALMGMLLVRGSTLAGICVTRLRD